MKEEVNIVDFEWEKIPEITDKGIVSGKIIFKNEISFNKFMQIKKEKDFIIIDKHTFEELLKEVR